MSTIVSLQKELELTKAELLHANETIALLAKGEDASATEHVSAELLKTIDMLKSAQREIRSLKIKKGLLATENDNLQKSIVHLNTVAKDGSKWEQELLQVRKDRGNWQSKYALLKNEYDELNKNLTFVLSRFRESV